MSTGQKDFVSSGFNFCKSSSLVLCVIMQKTSVVIASLMATSLPPVVVIAGATMRFAHLVKLLQRLYCPSYWWPLLVVIDAWMMRVACAGIVRLLPVLVLRGFGLHFCISSVSAIVIGFFGKSTVPWTLSCFAECLRKKASPIIGYEASFIIMKFPHKCSPLF